MKVIRNLFIYIVICLTLATGAFALDTDSAYTGDTAEAYSDTARAEEVQWVYMPIDGVMYKRLWSNTRGIWLTDWIPCE